MSDENKPANADFIGSGLSAVTSWFPTLPQFFKVIFASLFLYLLFCLVAQADPLILPRAIGEALTERNQTAEKTARDDKLVARAERKDIIDLLSTQLAVAQAVNEVQRAKDAASASNSQETQAAILALSLKIDALDARVAKIQTRVIVKQEVTPKPKP